MSDRPAVAFSICSALLKDLAGFRGYPREGERRFVEVLQEVSLSVEHARAIVQTFEENFPTIREIRDVAMNLRAKFIPSVDQRAEWEAEYGKPQPVELGPIKDRHELPDAALWREIIKRVGDRKKVQAMSWRQLAVIAREVGGFDEYADAWERSERHAG